MSYEHDEHEHDHDHPSAPQRAASPGLEENGKVYFRSLEEVADSPELKQFLEKEFPAGIEELKDPVSRRDFLGLMGASVAMAGFGSGCIRQPESHILPYSKRPEDVIPGLPTYYASTLSFAGMVTGVVVESHEGRPTKIEGNALHPVSEGGACAFEQAGILGVYNPDRVTAPHSGGQPTTWTAAQAMLKERLASAQGRQGQGLFVLHEQYSSPTFDAMAAKLRTAMPQAKVLEWEPISDDDVREGTRIAFGSVLEPVYRMSCDAILSVDADLFGWGPFRLRYAADFASRRNPDGGDGEHPDMNRLWCVEPGFTTTGAAADHRLHIRAEEAGPFLRVLAARLLSLGVPVPPELTARGDGGFPARFVNALASDLTRQRGRSVIAVGRRQPADVQALGHALNQALGAVGKTVVFARPQTPERTPHAESIRTLASALEAGQVETLVVLGGNPVFNAPADLDLAAAMKKAKVAIHLTEHKNETAELAGWVLPQSHWLEAWCDAVSPDGTYSVQQPLIRPIWDSQSPLEFMARLTGVEQPDGLTLLKTSFLAMPGQSETTWMRVLHDGLDGASAGKFVTTELDMPAITQAAARVPESVAPATMAAMEVVFVPSLSIWDGRFANNGWLQELPDPITKLSWSNAAVMSTATARALGVDNRDMVRVEVDGRTLDLPVWLQPGQADNQVVLALGYGRKLSGRVGNDRGFDVYRLRTTRSRYFAKGAKVTKIPGTFPLATMQDHNSMEGRPVVREATYVEFKKRPFFAREMVEHPPLVSLWKQHEYRGQQWGMAIDLTRCIGCNGCMIACQAENNIPIVGPEQMQKGREMYWIRLDRYFAGTNPADPNDLSEVEVMHQPVTCMHCENAPCESVCPVAATVHAPEGGTNDMIYNRCVGTRYCSNNCPYKVRRFNYYDWHVQNPGERHQPLTLVEELKFNPDVTVRTRGVMEKCTYCIQRIHQARRTAKLAGREEVPDGEITPACAQACPTKAIVFGDINNPDSAVTHMKKSPRNYEMLAELDTKPRTSYLAKIRNPHPELKS